MGINFIFCLDFHLINSADNLQLFMCINLCPVNGGEFTPPRRYFIRNEADPCPIFKRFFVTLLVGP